MNETQSGYLAMDLPDWNEGIKQDSSFEYSSPEEAEPISHTRPQPLPLALEVSRVRADTITAALAKQPSLQNIETLATSATTESLSAPLPNPMDANFWLQRAVEEENAGRIEKAVHLLRGALARGVMPAVPLAQALEDIQTRMRNSDAPPASTLEGEEQQEVEEQQQEQAMLEVMSEILNSQKTSARKPTPSKTGLSGKAVRVPRQYAKTPGAAKSAEGVVTAPRTNFNDVLKKLSFSTQKASEAGSMKAALPTNGTADAPYTRGISLALHQTTTTKELRFTDVPSDKSRAITAAAPATGATPGVELSSSLGQTGVCRHVRFGADTISPVGRKPRRFSFRTPEPSIAEQHKGFSSSDDPRNWAIEEGEEEYDGEDDMSIDLEGMSVNSSLAGRTPYSKTATELIKKYRVDDDDEFEGEPEFDVRSPETWRNLSSDTSVPNSIRKLATKYNTEQQEEAAGGDFVDNGFTFALPQQNQDQAPSPSTATAPVAGLPSMLAGRISPSGAIHLTPGLALRGPASHPLKLAANDDQNDEEDVFEDCSSDIDLSPQPQAAPSDRALGLTIPLSPALSLDGVPRDEQGIPLLTPGTVTCFRGSNASPRDDGLAVELFKEFTPPSAEAVEASKGDVDATAAAAVESDSVGISKDGDNSMVKGDGFEFFPVGGSSTPVPAQESSGTPDLHLKGEGHEPVAAVTPSGSIPSLSLLKGKAERVPTPPNAGSTPAYSVTKEIRSLMQGMQLSDGTATPPKAAANVKEERQQQQLQRMGSITMLSPARATPRQKKEMGANKVVTPVRRSARKQSMSPGAPVERLLEGADYAYAPNISLTPCAPAAAGNQQVRSTSAPTTTTSTISASTTPSLLTHTYATRSASKSSRKSEEMATSATNSTPSPATTITKSPLPVVASVRAAQRRKELHLTVPRTPPAGTTPSSSMSPVGGLTPTPTSAVVLAAASIDAVVPQDSSPELGESPTGGEALAAARGRRLSTGGGGGGGGGSLLASTLRKVHLEGTSTPTRSPTTATPGVISVAGVPDGRSGGEGPRSVGALPGPPASRIKVKGPSAIKTKRGCSNSPSTPDSLGSSMSPTERNIRESLRSSKKKEKKKTAESELAKRERFRTVV